MAPLAHPSDEIETLAGTVTAAITALGKSKAKTISKGSVLHLYHQAARMIPLGVDPFCDPTALFIELQEQAYESMPAERKLFTRKYWLIFDLIKHLSLSSKDDDLAALMIQMGAWASAARNEDTNTVKQLIVQILRPDPSRDLVIPPISPTDKSGRGFNHPMTARLLCPRKDLELFDSNPMDYMTKVNNNDIEILATDFPSFLYDLNIPYDPENEQQGLFRGYYAIRVFRAIFTGSSSAVRKTRACPKRSKAEVHEITRVSPETIAYSCVHARFSLSSTASWTPYDGTFDMVAFYNVIVSLLKDPEDQEVVQLFEYWNSEVPDLKRKSKKVRGIIQDPVISANKIDSMLAQRAKRKAAELAAAAAAAAGGSGGEDREQENSADENEGQADSTDEDGELGDGGQIGHVDGGRSVCEELEDESGNSKISQTERGDAAPSVGDSGGRLSPPVSGDGIPPHATPSTTDSDSRLSTPISEHLDQANGNDMPVDGTSTITKKSARLAKKPAGLSSGMPPRKKSKRS